MTAHRQSRLHPDQRSIGLLDGGPARDPAPRLPPRRERDPSNRPPHDPFRLTAPLLDAHQVAQRLGIRDRAVYELARRLHDPLPTVRLSERRIRFALGEIEEWAARQRRRTRP